MAANCSYDDLSNAARRLALELHRGGFKLLADRVRGKAVLYVKSAKPITPKLTRRLKAHCEELVKWIEEAPPWPARESR